jgi:RimJ/RimL family protein N-acetyltransferase
MHTLPFLKTDRLLLRPFTLADAPRVQILAGEYEIALNTALIQHPYPEGAAQTWITENEKEIAEGKCACFAVVDRGTEILMGAIGFNLEPKHRRAELGYWLGKPFWNRGFATEAGWELVRWAFQELEYQRVYAHHYARNPASGRVLEKIGMKPEGVQRRHVLKWGEFLDVVNYGIPRDEFICHW